MADIITLNCLIQGRIPSENVFPIDIDKNKIVGHLMAKIKDSNPKTFRNMDVTDVKLWKVDIPLEPVDLSDSNQAINKLALLEDKTNIDIANELGGVKLRPVNKIREVFTESLDSNNINVIVEQPSAILIEQSHDFTKFVIESQEKILQNTETIMDSLENLHTKVNALRRVIFQLHEDTVPRLFIILPEDGVWDFKADVLFTRSYRLYFLCEHRRVLPNGDEESKVHLAKHEGYKLRQPRQFVERYGSYIMQIMPYARIAIHMAKTSLELVPFVGDTASKLMETGVNICDTILSVTDSPVLRNKEYMHRKALEMCAGEEHLIAAGDYQAVSRLGSVGRPDLRALQAYLQGVDTYN